MDWKKSFYKRISVPQLYIYWTYLIELNWVLAQVRPVTEAPVLWPQDSQRRPVALVFPGRPTRRHPGRSLVDRPGGRTLADDLSTIRQAGSWTYWCFQLLWQTRVNTHAWRTVVERLQLLAFGFVESQVQRVAWGSWSHKAIWEDLAVVGVEMLPNLYCQSSETAKSQGGKLESCKSFAVLQPIKSFHHLDSTHLRLRTFSIAFIY